MSWAELYLHWEQYWFPITFVVSMVFVLYYGFSAPWYKTPFGRALITVDLGLAVSTFPGFVKFVFNSSVYENEAVAITIMAIATFVPIAIAYRIITLWAIRHRKGWKDFRSGRRLDDDGNDLDK